jgi:hypothetical protein
VFGAIEIDLQNSVGFMQGKASAQLRLPSAPVLANRYQSQSASAGTAGSEINPIRRSVIMVAALADCLV